jgi:5-(carboxyamino)imidazole ribonucleotide mutase
MAPQVGIIIGIVMGSDSDLDIMKAAAEVCEEFDIGYEIRVLSAHRSPHDTTDYASRAHERGIKVIIAGAGGAAHLAGVIAAHTPLPVIGVPIKSAALSGQDSLLSIVQMPAGVPVATVAIDGARNAGLLAIQILATGDAGLLDRFQTFKAALVQKTHDKDRRLQERVSAGELLT